jgi:hypothetical protein
MIEELQAGDKGPDFRLEVILMLPVNVSGLYGGNESQQLPEGHL